MYTGDRNTTEGKKGLQACSMFMLKISLKEKSGLKNKITALKKSKSQFEKIQTSDFWNLASQLIMKTHQFAVTYLKKK